MKKNIEIVLFLIVLATVGLTLLKITFANIEGYEGYCSYEDISFGNFVNIFEVSFLFIFTLFIILRKFYGLKERNIIKKWPNLSLTLLIMNLGLISQQIILYPRVLSYSKIGLWGYTIPKNDQHMGLDYHPHPYSIRLCNCFGILQWNSNEE